MHRLELRKEAIDYWNRYQIEVCINFEIKIFERNYFESLLILYSTPSTYYNSYTTIYEFIRDNIENCLTYTIEENIIEILSIFKKETIYNNLQLKAIFLVAFFEVLDKYKIKHE